MVSFPSLWCKLNISTVGRNPAPVDRWYLPLFTGFCTSHVVQDFFHQQYLSGMLQTLMLRYSILSSQPFARLVLWVLPQVFWVTISLAFCCNIVEFQPRKSVIQDWWLIFDVTLLILTVPGPNRSTKGISVFFFVKEGVYSQITLRVNSNVVSIRLRCQEFGERSSRNFSVLRLWFRPYWVLEVWA